MSSTWTGTDCKSWDPSPLFLLFKSKPPAICPFPQLMTCKMTNRCFGNSGIITRTWQIIFSWAQLFSRCGSREGSSQLQNAISKSITDISPVCQKDHAASLCAPPHFWAVVCSCHHLGAVRQPEVSLFSVNIRPQGMGEAGMLL